MDSCAYRCHQFCEGGFAAAGVTDQGNTASCRDMKRDAFEYWLLFQVSEGDILKANIAYKSLRAIVGNAGIDHFRSLVKHFLDTLGAGGAITGQGSQL